MPPPNGTDPPTARVLAARAGALVLVVVLAVALADTRNDLRAVRNDRAAHDVAVAAQLDGLREIVERQSALIRATGTAAARAQAAELDALAERLVPRATLAPAAAPATSTSAPSAPIVVTVRPGAAGPSGPPGAAGTPGPTVTITPAPAPTDPCLLDVLTICLRRPQQ